jgi:1,4-alpha-glucan branching enzyme
MPGKSSKKRVDFTIHAPGAQQVCVAGTFNEWDISARPLRRGKGDQWRTWMSLPPGDYEYQFVVDGRWREDPACGQSRPTPYGSHNSVFQV